MKKFIFILILCLPVWVGAKHLVGGCFQLTYVSGNTYNLKVKILRDCQQVGGADYDDPIQVGIYDKGTNAQKQIVSLNYDASTRSTLKFTGPNCANITDGCTEIAIYSANITLNPTVYNNNVGYYFSWQRCCRNNIISNIVQPGAAAMTLYEEIPSPKFLRNSSPAYTNNPNTLLCANNLFSYNMGFTDPDGDELKYSLITPLNGNLNQNNVQGVSAGPYANVVWLTGYSASNTIQGTLPLTIDPTTGQLTCNPTATGVYVASIRVEEYRFGSKIGEIRLELQLTVTNCPNIPPLQSVTTINDLLLTTDTVEVTVPDNICLKIRGTDPTDSIYMRIRTPFMDSIFVNKPTFDSVTAGNMMVETKFCFQTACEHERLKSPFPVEVDLVDNGCPISRNAYSKFWVKVKPMPVTNPTTILCMTLVNNKETYFYYGDSTDPKNPFFSKYYIYKGVNYSNMVVIDSVMDKLGKVYHDYKTPNYNTINYTYYMASVNKCGRVGPVSDTMSTFEQLKFIPDMQYFKYATVVDNSKIEIVWPPSWERDFAKYYLYKNRRGENQFNLIKTLENVNDTSYTDTDVGVMDTSYCYYLVMRDTCDNYGPMGKVACSMVLKGRSEHYASRLNWNDYIGWKSGVDHYEVYRSDPATPFANITKTDTISQFLDDRLNLNEGLFSYYILAKEKFAEATPYFSAESRSNTISLVQPPIVYVPNAFTANGDGLNDQFNWVPVFVKDFNIQIYNRWGEMIYESNDKLSTWNGTAHNQPCAADVYFYRMNYTGWEGTEKYNSGNFTLLR